MNMIAKIKEKFNGEVYDILGKPRTEPVVLDTIYFTDKYWFRYQEPMKGFGEHHIYSMGNISKRSQIASGISRDTPSEAYDRMLAEHGELTNKYR